MREEGCEKSASGATTQASSNAELLSGRSERRCGAHIHANRGLYALSSPNGSKNLKRSSGVLHPGPSKYTSKTVYQLIEQRAFLHPLGGGEDGTRVFDCGNQPGCFIFTCAHPGKRMGPRTGFRFRFRLPFPVSGFRIRIRIRIRYPLTVIT